jgi:hypothetical protein
MTDGDAAAPRRLPKGRLKRLKRRGPKPPARARAGGDDVDEPRPREQRPAAPARPRSRATIAALAVAGALVAGGIYLATRPPAAPAAPAAPVARGSAILDAVPAGALAVITADVRALRASPLAAPYLGGSRSVPGFDDVRQACGFDLIASVDELAIAIPDGQEADFGIVATGGFADAAILDCASKVVQARGGSPVVTSIGSFKSVRDSSSQASSGETATRPGGVLLWGGGPYVRTMIDAAEGKVPSVRGSSVHDRLRAELSGFETVQATYAFSQTQRAAVADEIQKAQGKAPSVLAHVIGAGLGVRLVDQKASLSLVLLADDPAKVGELSGWLADTKRGAASGVPAQLLGAAPLLERATVSASGALVRVSLDATVGEIEGILDKALAIRAMLEKEARPAPLPPPPALDASASASAPPTSSAQVAPAPSAAATPTPSAQVAPAPSASTPAPRRKKKTPDPGAPFEGRQ